MRARAEADTASCRRREQESDERWSDACEGMNGEVRLIEMGSHQEHEGTSSIGRAARTSTLQVTARSARSATVVGGLLSATASEGCDGTAAVLCFCTIQGHTKGARVAPGLRPAIVSLVGGRGTEQRVPASV